MVLPSPAGFFAYGQTYFGEWISQRVAYDIRNDIYSHLQRLSFAYHDKAQTGQFMSRATQDVGGRALLHQHGRAPAALHHRASSCRRSSVMLVTDWQLALIAWFFIPIVAYRSARVTLSLRPIWLAVQDLQGRMGTVLQENLSGMRVVKAFAREQHESVKFSKEAKELFENGYESNRIQAFNTPLISSIWMLAMVCVTWCGRLADQPTANLSAGDLAALCPLLEHAPASSAEPRLDRDAVRARAVVGRAHLRNPGR